MVTVRAANLGRKCSPPVASRRLHSLSKVSATTSAVMTFYERGELDLDLPVADASLLGPRYAQQGKGPITSRNLLLHNAGYPPDPAPGYSEPQVRVAVGQRLIALGPEPPADGRVNRGIARGGKGGCVPVGSSQLCAVPARVQRVHHHGWWNV